jgi:hypothetical protein
MTRPLSRARRASFIVRVIQNRQGEVNGVIERVATGAKEVFQGMEAIGPVIAGMLVGEPTIGPPARTRGLARRSMLSRGTGR